jgi:phytoene dehydrogenase-like protein
LERSVTATAQGLGQDGTRYTQLMQPLVDEWQGLAAEFLQPMLHLPRRPFLLARFGWRSIQSAAGLALRWFEDEPARAVFAGLAAHSFLPLEQRASASFGLVLGMMAHAVGWPFPEGGAQRFTDALAAHLQSLSGSIECAHRVASLDELSGARAVLLDLTPKQVLRIAGDRLPAHYRRQLETYRYGPGVFKLDYALRGPIPWTAEVCRRAGTVHLGGSLEEIRRGERQVAEGQIPERPFVLVAQQSLFDGSRAPADQHTLWAYCHVPNGSGVDMTAAIERQIERFAPGFRDQVLARHAINCAQLEASNANLVGGDISGGAMNLWQLIARPVARFTPYRTAIGGLYLCSAATPPGSGVHRMCGFHAANAALRDVFKRELPRHTFGARRG